MTESSPLNGIKVVALEVAAAGPFATRVLADMGAEVLKIERPGIGDTIRQWDSAVRGISSGYVWANRNKRSITVNVQTESGRSIVRRLIEQADVFLENFAPGVAGRLGLGYEEVRTGNPRLIYCSLSGYGQDGPYRDRKAFDVLIQGEAGFIATTGYPDQPAKMGLPVVDIAAGMYAAMGVLMALVQRHRTGVGQVIDISMFESALSWLAYFPHHYWHRGELPERVGMRHHFVTPYGPFMAADGRYVSLAVANARDWETFCQQVLARPDLFAEPRFATVELRRENRSELERMLEELFLEHDSHTWLQRLEEAKLAYGEIRGIDEVLAHPQAVARRVVREVDSPVGPVPVIASPIRMSGGPARYGPVPSLGGDTDAILREAGYAEDDIAGFRAQGAI